MKSCKKLLNVCILLEVSSRVLYHVDYVNYDLFINSRIPRGD